MAADSIKLPVSVQQEPEGEPDADTMQVIRDATGRDLDVEEIAAALNATSTPGPLAGLLEAIGGLEREQDAGWSPAARSHLRRARTFSNMAASAAIPSSLAKPDSGTLEQELRGVADAWQDGSEVRRVCLRAASFLARSVGARGDFIFIADIEEEIEHVKQNGIDVAKFGGQNENEGRCRELCAMYLHEFIVAHRMQQQLDALKSDATPAAKANTDVPADWHEDMRAAWEREKLRADQLERELFDARQAETEQRNLSGSLLTERDELLRAVLLRAKLPSASAQQDDDDPLAGVPDAAVTFRRATPSENLRILRARLSEHLSPAELRELEEAATILDARPTSARVEPTEPERKVAAKLGDDPYAIAHRRVLIEANEAVIAGHVEGYEFRGDEGDHTTTDAERVLIEDAIAGLLADDDFVRTFNAWQDAVRSSVPSATPRAELSARNIEDLPITCEAVGGVLDMRIGEKVLAFATENCPELWDADKDHGLYRVTNAAIFAKDVARELNRESEDGSTPLSRLLDEVCEEAINQGSEGVEEYAPPVDMGKQNV